MAFGVSASHDATTRYPTLFSISCLKLVGQVLRSETPRQLVVPVTGTQA